MAIFVVLARRPCPCVRACILCVLLAVLTLCLTTSGIADTPCLVHNGSPFYPIGVYDYPGGSFSANGSGNAKDHLSELSSAGFNCYQTDMTKLGNTEINAAAPYGICVVPYAGTWLTDSQYYVTGSAFDSKLTEIGSNPNLLMYYSCDEPYMYHLNNGGGWPSLSVMLAGHQFLQSRDSTHPIWYNECPNLPDWDGGTIQGGRDWTGIGDVCSQDMYPALGSFPNNDLNQITSALEDLKQLTDADNVPPYQPTKPVFMVLQGCGSHDWDSTKNGPRPTFAETSFMTYASIIHGARGSVWWGTCCLEPTAQTWTDIKVVAGQLRDLQAVLLTDNVSGFTVASPLEATLRNYNGDNYLIVVNSSSSQRNNVPITVPGWNFARNGNSVPVMFEARGIPATSTTWTDSFGPWGVHIYTDKVWSHSSATGDLMGDGYSDLMMVEPNSTWHVLNRSGASSSSVTYALGDLSQGDIPVPGCYEAVKKCDPAMFSPSTGTWRILTSASNYTQTVTYQLGTAGDVPVPGDYDGDGQCDCAVYRPSTGGWLILKSSSGYTSTVTYTLGSPGDKPVPADYDGDGKLDLAVYRPWTSEWFILTSSSGYTQSLHYQYGQIGDKPVPADYDGDGKADIAICRPGSPMIWSFLRSTGNNPPFATFTLGDLALGDIPVPADYDGDGRADMCVYRPGSTSQWITLSSLLNHQAGATYSFGQTGWYLVGGAGQLGEDWTPPSKPSVIDSNSSTTSKTTLSACWWSTDQESRVVGYIYAIGTTSGGTNTVPWTYVGTSFSVSRTDLSLTRGSTYYFSVRAVNAAGYWSDIGTSAGCKCVSSLGYSFNAVACLGGTAAGSGNFSVGASVTATATANPGYQFVGWSKNSCGGTIVSTNASYTFSMPTSTYTLHANFSQASYTITTGVCDGGTATGGGLHPVNAPATVTAVPGNGYCFVNWTSDGCGGTSVVSRSPSYTLTMPTSDLALYANFARGELLDGFEGMAAGDVNMNDSSGANKATNGDTNSGNPWSGPAAPNGAVIGGSTSGVNPHTGSKMLYAAAGYANSIAMANVAYRCNSGIAFTGGVYLDWWFYDPKGTAADSNTYQDYAALCFYPASIMPTNADYGTFPIPLTGATQSLSLGASVSTGAGYDHTKYQARVIGAAGYDGSGWSNLSLVRSIGWHHGRINVSPAKTSGTNDVKFYIDDMSTALLTADSTTTAGYNSIQFNLRPSSSSNATGYFDDLTFGSAPAAPTAAAGDATANQITWHWAATDPVDGYTVSDSLGNVKGTTNGSVTSCTETGLTANTRYTRYVVGYQMIDGGQVISSSTMLPATYTLAVPPAYGVSGPGAFYCARGPGSTTAWYPLGTSITFTAMNGLGTGSTRASKYLYVWDSSPADPAWSGATESTNTALTKSSSVAGRYYLHIRACNGDGVANPATLTLGPYDFRTYTPVSRISDAWTQANMVDIGLSSKCITAVIGGAVWVEELDRSAAMKILFTGYAVQGDLANVYGDLQASANPRVMAAGWVQDLGPSEQIVNPLMMNTACLGGTGLNSSTPGVSYGRGLYNVGLLVEVAGCITYRSTDDALGKYFYLDDGGGLRNGTTHPGVKVLCGSSDPPAGGYATVIGVVDTELVGSDYVPVVQVRDPAEIVAY